MPFAGLKHSGHGVGGIKYTMHEMQIEKNDGFKKLILKRRNNESIRFIY